MTPKNRIASSSFIAIENFIVNSGWIESKASNVAKFFTPPRELGLDEKFALAIPLSESVSSSSNLFYENVRVLQDIYGKTLSELLQEIETPNTSSPWLFKARLIGDSIGAGTISLSKIETYLSQVTKSFYEVAKFKLGGDEKIHKLQAKQFVENCQFQPTGAGSFITSIEIPYEEIRHADLVSPSVTSQEIVSNWFSAMDFINTSVLNGSEDYYLSESAVSDAIQLFNVPLAESLKKLVEGTSASRFDFELNTQVGRRTSSTGMLNSDSIGRLSGFVKFFRESLINENNLTVVGKIFELRSSDPDGNKNHVAIKANIYGDLTVVSMTLNNQQYRTAIQAHREGRNVRVMGDAVRLKTQTRITHIDDIQFA